MLKKMSLDRSKAGPNDRDLDSAISALKKGVNLLKYGRRGKPKFCPFKLSNDECFLVWHSGKTEKRIKLSQISRIIRGQHTPVFQRHPRPEKEPESFSVLYKDRSLDLICKDEREADIWFTGLKAIISRVHREKSRAVESKNNVILSKSSSPKALDQNNSPLTSPFVGDDTSYKDKALPNAKSLHMEAYRVSSSSAISTSSQGSNHDGNDAFGHVFVWGEGVSDGILGGGFRKFGSSSSAKMDAYLPKSLESALVIDVQGIACGAQHAVLVNKQGEVFSWGEESSGRLGHGVDCDVSCPKLVDGLKNINIEFAACGEYNSCAVTLAGEMYMWGGSSFKSQVTGHANEARQWIPKKVNGALEGIHVSFVSCGPWHTTIVTSAGQLFTFGDGTFGALGHGDQKNVPMPREVESLKGLRTMRAACGVWHTSAIVEVIVGSSSSGKLFTWGDGDKGRLGHGDKETKLIPTCVAALVEPSFRQVACGQSLTVALTTTGHVYTMGSPVFGQLGDPQADGKLPRRVQGKLTKHFVEDIACGAYHVAVLTSRSEVFTWGKGANGRLGHGDTEDRGSPMLVESLKDKQVKSIVCGAHLTAAICLHKSHSDFDHLACHKCRLPFNFKRKRHNCYNCGLAVCHPCSCRKALKAAMAPNSKKPYRVCDNCFEKLRKTIEISPLSHMALSRRGSVNQGLSELIEMNTNLDLNATQEQDIGSVKRNKKLGFNSNRVLPLSSRVSENGIIDGSKSFNPMFGSSKKFFSVSLPGSRMVSRATSPTSRRCSPPRAKTPVPNLSLGFTLSRGANETQWRNESVVKEVVKLRTQVRDLTSKSQLQETELDKTTRQLKEALAIAAEETAKCKAAKEVIKSLTAQLKDMAERLPARIAKNGVSTVPSSRATTPTKDVSVGAVDRQSSPSILCNMVNAANNGFIDTDILSFTATAKSKNRAPRIEGTNTDEWVEQDETGVYLTLTSLPGGLKSLKRVRFSRKRFSEKEAEQWWAENRARVYQRFNVHPAGKFSVG